MSMFLARPTQFSQTGQVEIDTSSLLAKGLVRVLIPDGFGLRDLIAGNQGIALTGTGFTRTATPKGVGTRNNSLTAANKTSVDVRTEKPTSVTLVWAGTVNQVGGTTYPFFRNGQSIIQASSPTNPVWSARFNVASNQTSTTPIKVGLPTTYAYSQNIGTGQLYVDGQPALSDIAGGTATNWNSISHVIDGNNGFNQSNDITTTLFLIYDRPLSKQELVSISTNPWQIFKPVQRRLYFDIPEPSSTVTVSSFFNGSYPVRGSVSNSVELNYPIRYLASRSFAYSYFVLSQVQASLNQSYLVRTNASKSSSNSYLIRGSVLKDYEYQYFVRTAISDAFETQYFVRGSVLQSLIEQYSIRSQVNSDYELSFAVRSSTLSDLSLAWDVRTYTNKDFIAEYQIENATSVIKSISFNYNVRGQVNSDKGYSYNILKAVQSSLGTDYFIRVQVQEDLTQDFVIRKLVNANLEAQYGIIGSVLSSKSFTYQIQGLVQVQSSLTALYQILEEIAPDYKVVYVTGNSDKTITLSSKENKVVNTLTNQPVIIVVKK